MHPDSPLAKLIDGMKLKPFRVTCPREDADGNARDDTSIVLARSPAEAWAQFNDSRQTSRGIHAPGVKIEPAGAA